MDESHYAQPTWKTKTEAENTSPLCPIASARQRHTSPGRRGRLPVASTLVSDGCSDNPEILCLLRDILERLDVVESEVGNVLRAVEPLDDGDAYTEGGSARDMEDGSGSDVEEDVGFGRLSCEPESKEQ